MKKIEFASLKAKQNSNAAVKLIENQNEKGETVMALDSAKKYDPGFKKVADYLLTSDVRKHNRYCPCCRQYEQGKEPSLSQMSEFLEYIR